jgi:Zn ribbon nucleic-acid-binding protein
MKWTPTTIKATVLVVLGVLIIGFTVWRTHPGRQKRPVVDYSKAKFMHCPECNAEVRFDEEKLDLECVQCGATKGMVATEESLKQSSTKSRYGRLIAFVMPELCLLLTALWFVLKPRQGDIGELQRDLGKIVAGEQGRVEGIGVRLADIGVESRIPGLQRINAGRGRPGAERDERQGKRQQDKVLFH